MGGKNIVYVASCSDLASKEKLESVKIGITESDADKRILALNSTKQPFLVELEAAWTFENSALDALQVEQAFHSLLEPDRVNGEWFKDPDGDLVARVGKAIAKLGGQPVGSLNPELKEMNDRQLEELEKMQLVFEPIRSKLDALGVHWEYMTKLVGVDSAFGRLRVRVKSDGKLYIAKTASLHTAKELNAVSGLDWKEGIAKNNRMMCNDVTPDQLLDFLELGENLSQIQREQLGLN